LAPEEELGAAFRVVTEKLRALGYYVVFDVLNAADFGAPQVRQRLVVLGSRFSEPIAMPRPTHSEGGTGELPRWRTLRHAIGGLQEDAPEFYRFCPGKERYLADVPEGGNWRDLPEERKSEALGKAYVSWGGRSGFFRRLAWERTRELLDVSELRRAILLCGPRRVGKTTILEQLAQAAIEEDGVDPHTVCYLSLEHPYLKLVLFRLS